MSCKPVFRNWTFVIMLIFLIHGVTGVYGPLYDCLCSANAMYLLKQRKRVFRAFPKFQEASISFVMCVCPHGISGLSLDEFSLDLVFRNFPKVSQESHLSLKSDKKSRYFI